MSTESIKDTLLTLTHYREHSRIFKEQILDVTQPISDGASLSNFELEQSAIEERVTHNSVMAIKLHSLIDIQVIRNNDGKQFS